MRTLLVAVLAVIGYVDAGKKFSCKNMQGKDVDWFVALKLPSYVDNRKGRTFAYFDATQREWTWSKQPINSTESAIGATVQQLYASDNKTTFKTAYNDDVPNHLAEGSGRGHSKGVIVFGEQQGFWLVHSVPRYPSPYKYEYPDSGSIFAQSFLCLTLPIDELEKVANYLRFSQVTPFITNRPKDFDVA
ncbi:unnamed protein product [Heligmosomoides polygyrus]|uniref:Deoxyribonuclease II n=1 Tax=Heligmosomoides polygyrus TaxID=6339 RepID=A0A183FJ39_HELPZ|nr:unnamed protein product [Heligmosomoides polygyrus]